MIFITDVSNFLNNGLFDSGLKLCDDWNLNRILRYKFPMDRARSLCGLLLARYAYACFFYPDFLTRMSFGFLKEHDRILSDTRFSLDFTGIIPADNTVYKGCLTPVAPEELLFKWDFDIQWPGFVYLASGKPAVNNCHNFNFSITHSGDLAAVFSRESSCGIDLQEFCRVNASLIKKILSPMEKMKFEDIYSLHFCPDKDDKSGDFTANKGLIDKLSSDVIFNDERNFYDTHINYEGKKSEDLRGKNLVLDYFFRCWSGKEAYHKITGLGLKGDLCKTECDLYNGVINYEGEHAKVQSGTFFYKNGKYSLSIARR